MRRNNLSTLFLFVTALLSNTSEALSIDNYDNDYEKEDIQSYPDPVVDYFYSEITKDEGDMVYSSLDHVTNEVTENFRWSDVKDNVVANVFNTCGKRRVCNLTGYEDAEDFIKCSPCDSCYCDTSCEMYGDCCPDYIIDHKLKDMFANETFPSTDLKVSECVDIFFKGSPKTADDAYASQRLITKCPILTHDQVLLDQCDNSGEINQDSGETVIKISEFQTDNYTRENLEKNWPVVSEGTSVSYKNRACAACHNDDNSLAFWDIKIFCSQPVPTSSTSSPDEVLDQILARHDCQIAFIAPEESLSRPCNRGIKLRGVPHVYTNVCNSTGTRMSYSLFLWKACEMFSLKYHFPGETFRNPFCHNCQLDSPIFGSGSPYCSNNVGDPFFLVISPRALQKLQEARRRRDCTCPNDHTYDVYKKTCRKIHCGNGKIYKDNKCIATAKTSNGLAYSLSLRFQATLSEDDVMRLNASVFPPSMDFFLKLTTAIKASFLDKNFADELKKRNVEFATFNSTSLIVPAEAKSTVSVDIFMELFVKYHTSPSDLETLLLSNHKRSWNLKVGDDFEMQFTSVLAPKPPKDLPKVRGGENAFEAKRLAVSVRGLDTSHFYVAASFTKIYTTFSSVHITEFELVRNTLNCPTFLYDLAKDDDVTIRYPDIGEEGEPVLKHNASGVELSFLDFSVTNKDTVIVCAEKIMAEMEESAENDDVSAIDIFGSGLVITSYVCLGLSALALFATFVTYCIFPPLRTLPGKCTMALVLTLFLAIILFLVGGVFSDMTAVCQTVGVATHFFLMSAFTWMVICTAHMYRVFAHVMEHHSNEEKHAKKFTRYVAFSVIIPSVIVSSTIIGNYVATSTDDEINTMNTTDVNNNTGSIADKETTPLPDCDVTETLIGYGNGICYISNKYSLLLASALPIILLCVANLAMFGMTICALRKMTEHEKLVKKEARGHVYLYMKLSTLTGINWLPCTVAAFVSSAVIWYTFLVLCGLQGVYVFVSFVLNKRVLKMYGRLLGVELADSTSGASGSNVAGKNNKNRYVNGGTHSDDVKTFTTYTSVGSSSLEMKKGCDGIVRGVKG